MSANTEGKKNVELLLPSTYLQVFILNTRLIATQSLNGNPLLSIIKELGRNWRVGHENANDNSPNTTQSTNDDELISPRGKGSFDMANGVTK